MHFSTLASLGLCAGALLFTAGCDRTGETGATEAPADIVAIAAGQDEFSTLVAAIQQAGLVDTLQGEGPFTVFAPSDAAFAALPEGTLASLSPEQLTTILEHHVVPGIIASGDAVDAIGGEVTTLADTTLAVATDRAGKLTVGGSRVVATDIVTTNGIIHVVDAVILP